MAMYQTVERYIRETWDREKRESRGKSYRVMGDYGYTKVELVYRIILLDSTESGQRNIPIENISP